ncbi:MAG: restriction endonuclease [Chloroflexi bacterium]|nr:restriction endonuclease [Chloroflexota bacterium]
MKKRTIIEAIKEVMLAENRPMSVTEVYEVIIQSKLYEFKADQPMQIVRAQLRRHTKDLDFPSASSTKHFIVVQNGKFDLLDKPTTQDVPQLIDGHTKPIKSSTIALVDVKKLHQQYVEDFKRRVLDQIKKLDPASFEVFCKNLLVAYGFRSVEVTRATKDGGIDGYGKLKVGFTHLNVAFQCKRWGRKAIGRPEINQFRGDIQGQYEMGIFFTTSNFSSDAESNSFKSGAVPIILINGQPIVEIMIENRFGIDADHLPTYTLALDNALSSDS